MEVDLAADEVLVRVRLPAPVPASGSAYEKYRLRQVDTALVGAAVWLQVDETGEAIRDARIGLAAAGPTPVRSLAAEDALRGPAAIPEALARAAAAAAPASGPLNAAAAS